MKSVLRNAVFALLLASPATAATYEPVDGNRIIVLDGDTVALPCKTPGRGCSERVRLRDIDAPEVFHPDCHEGLQQGLKAKARLAQLIRGKVVYVERDGHRDLYGRTLGALRIGSPSGVNAGMQLVREDLARPWKAGAAAREERRLWWCGPQN
ncbi:thermonuclease family protein [Labrys neptuniae]|uniref:Thermonuclease family protein n=1 Tax=Labrys neptuniae TaxID=376174 RepID=A0ABV3PG34_9HYPH